MTTWSVGLDVGGTKTLALLLDDAGRIGAQRRLGTVGGPAGVVATCVRAVDELLVTAGVHRDALVGVGLGLPGIIDPARGSVARAVNLALADEQPLAAQVAAGLGGVPVRLENDLNAAVLGARHMLAVAGESVDDLAFLALGTGLAAGLLLDGVLRRGAHGAAGEIGHLVHVPGGAPCKCGQRGCLERYASGSALDAAWPGVDGRPAPVELFAAARAGDERAIAVQQSFVGAVASAVRVLVLTCDVQRVVIGGGVSELGRPLLDALVGRLEQEAAASPFLADLNIAGRVRLAPPGVPVGAVGAALVGRRED